MKCRPLAPRLARLARLAPPASLAALALLSYAPAADAHIKLTYPPSWIVEDDLGNPQKEGPCGSATGTPTNAVTTFAPGEKIVVKWTETVAHDGHFRIALARQSRDELELPATVADKSGNSVSATIEKPVTAPVLLDGLYVHAAADLSGQKDYEQEITLPDEPCEHCTLQVIQFMAKHPQPYFYQHCADIRISTTASGDGGTTTTTGPTDGGATAGGTPDAGASSTGGGGTTTPSTGTGLDAGTTSRRDASTSGADDATSASDGGGCAVSSGASPAGSLAASVVASLGLFGLLRRRGRPDRVTARARHDRRR